MKRLYLIRVTDDSTKTLLRLNETAISEFLAGLAFVVLMLAVLFGPYLLGCFPGVEAGLVGGLE